MGNVDKIGKTSVESKDEIKKRIGRSPDYADMIMMRMYYEIKRKKTKTYVY
jgi:predicted nucleic acid-binding OB-fold protein